MKSMSIHELDNVPGVLECAVDEETVVLTSAGKPFALVVGLHEGEGPAELDRIIRQARAQWALSSAREAARLNGTDKLTMEEIIAESVRLARSVRRGDGAMPRVRKHLSLDAAAVSRATIYAERRSISLSRVVDELLMRLPLDDENAQLTPTVRRLLGIAKGDAGREDHRAYLLDKYGA